MGEHGLRFFIPPAAPRDGKKNHGASPAQSHGHSNGWGFGEPRSRSKPPALRLFQQELKLWSVANGAAEEPQAPAEIKAHCETAQQDRGDQEIERDCGELPRNSPRGRSQAQALWLPKSSACRFGGELPSRACDPGLEKSV